MNYNVEFSDGNIDNINMASLKTVMFPVCVCGVGGTRLCDAAT